jgi:hypothetical protein
MFDVMIWFGYRPERLTKSCRKGCRIAIVNYEQEVKANQLTVNLVTSLSVKCAQAPQYRIAFME